MMIFRSPSMISANTKLGGVGRIISCPSERLGGKSLTMRRRLLIFAVAVYFR